MQLEQVGTIKLLAAMDWISGSGRSKLKPNIVPLSAQEVGEISLNSGLHHDDGKVGT